MATTSPSFELVGRENESAKLDDFVTRLKEEPGAFVVRGEPGIGKTALVRTAIDEAQRHGVRVLVSRCAEAEMPIPLGAICDLLDTAFEDVEEVLTEPQRRVIAAALGLESAVRPPDRLALARAVVGSLDALAAESPVLIALDDVQWLDSTSTRLLAFAARRTAGMPLGIVATLRGDASSREPLGLADAFGPEAFRMIELGPLSIGALQHLIRLRFDIRLPRSKLTAIHAASGGNPMFALEFARSAEREEAGLRGLLPVPTSLEELVRDQARAFPETVRPVMESVAVIARPTLPLLARKYGGAKAAEAAIDEAVSVGAIAVSDEGVVRFTHPLLASAVYFGMTTSRRRALHQEAAELVDDLEQEARHLALATPEPDGAIADVVERGAAAAAARGAPDAAAVFAAEAVRLTPPEDGSTRTRRKLAVAGLLLEAGDVAAARAHVEPFLGIDVPAAVRGQALVIRAETEHQDRMLLQALLREAIEISPDPRVQWQAWIRYAQHGGWVSGDAGTAANSAREALRIALELRDDSLIAAATACFAYYEAGRGHLPDVDDERLIAAERVQRVAPWQITPSISVGSRLLWAGELDRAREVLRREYDELVRQGSLLRLPLVLLAARVDLEWRAGRWAEADAYCEEARTILDDALPGGAHVLYYARLLLAGSFGRLDEARRLAADGLRLSEHHVDRVNPIRVRWALGHVELANGDPVAAWQALEGLPDALETFGIAEPAWQPILPDVIETLVALDRTDDAEAVLERLEQQATALRHRWATAASRRCRAVVLTAHSCMDKAADTAERAAREFEQLGFPLDRARSLLVAGAARRRAGHRRHAAQLLQPAMEVLSQLPAPLWQERAEAELRRARPRPRRDGELTNAERRVAALVAEGMTNREVAAQLFTTVATVEAHLTRIYRKLGVRSRTELARRAADGALQLGE